jgi:predicted ArsR family transcriptional regulator
MAGKLKKRIEPRFGSRRLEVVDLLRRGIGTVAELAKHLRLTDNAVRSHLLLLEKRGLVRRSGLEKGVSRPHVLFKLTSETTELFPHAYDAALGGLINAMKRRLQPEIVTQLLQLAGANLARRFPNGEKKESVLKRTRSAVRILNLLGGSAWLHREQGMLTIRNSSCPLSAVVREHPETCALMEKFLSRLCGTRVKETCARGKTPRCLFRLQDDKRDKPIGTNN